MLFRNEFGDIIYWRVALVGTATLAASVGLALALFAGTPTDATGTDDTYDGYVYEYRPTDYETGPQEASDGLTGTRDKAADAESTAQDDDAGGRGDENLAWLGGADDSRLLHSLTPEAAAALHDAVSAWVEEAGTAEGGSEDASKDASLNATLVEAEATPEATRVRLRVAAEGAARTLEATLAPGGTWQLAEVADAETETDTKDGANVGTDVGTGAAAPVDSPASAEPVAPEVPTAPVTPAAPTAPADPVATVATATPATTPAPVAPAAPTAPVDPAPAPSATPAPTTPATPATMPIADTALLSQVTGEAVATGLKAQLAASGLPGASLAWTTSESVHTEGSRCRLTLWLPTGTGAATRYEATFDAGVGLLEIEPATDGEGVA